MKKSEVFEGENSSLKKTFDKCCESPERILWCEKHNCDIRLCPDNHPNKMSEESKKEWEDKLITTLPACDIKVIDDYYSLKLAKQQEEFVKLVKDFPHDLVVTHKDKYKEYLICKEDLLADIKSKLLSLSESERK